MSIDYERHEAIERSADRQERLETERDELLEALEALATATEDRECHREGCDCAASSECLEVARARELVRMVRG